MLYDHLLYQLFMEHHVSLFKSILKLSVCFSLYAISWYAIVKARARLDSSVKYDKSSFYTPPLSSQMLAISFLGRCRYTIHLNHAWMKGFKKPRQTADHRGKRHKTCANRKKVRSAIKDIEGEGINDYSIPTETLSTFLSRNDYHLFIRQMFITNTPSAIYRNDSI